MNASTAIRFTGLVLVGIVVLSASVPRATQASIPLSLDAYFWFTEPSLSRYTANPDTGTATVPFKTTDHFVSIDGVGGTTWLADWFMRLSLLGPLGGESDIIDSDNGGGNVTLDEDGHWQHLAHGTGILQGSRTLAAQSANYQAFAKSLIRVTRGDETASANMEGTKDFQVWLP